MTELEILKRLASAARREGVPHVDVSRSVLYSLDTAEDEFDRCLAWMAAVSVAAALPVTALAFRTLEALTDPLGDLFSAFGGMIL